MADDNNIWDEVNFTGEWDDVDFSEVVDVDFDEVNFVDFYHFFPFW